MKKTGYIITRNGKTNHLPQTLENLENWIDNLVISVDTDSNDGTWTYCKEHPAVDHVIAHQGEWPSQEPEIRRKAYKYSKITCPEADIMIALDDDELIPDKEAAEQVMQKMLDENIDLGCAGTFHLWEEDKFRKDYNWHPQNSPHQILENLRTDRDRTWQNRGPHCGRLPTKNFDGTQTGLFAVMHFGWHNVDHEQKLKQKKGNDPRSMGELPIAQEIHYKSFEQEPVLEKIPGEWTEHL